MLIIYMDYSLFKYKLSMNKNSIVDLVNISGFICLKYLKIYTPLGSS